MTTEAYDKLTRIDFNDGHPIGVAWDGWTLLLDYRNWQEKVVRFTFKGVAHVSGYGGGASLCSARVSVNSPEIDRVKELLGRDWGTNETWNEAELTELVIFDDVSLLTVIFQDVEIEYLGDETATIDSTFADFHDSET
jgi:hypothetical protein